VYVAVVGPAQATGEEAAVAEDIGARLASRGAVVVTGGLGGVMEAASRGAARAGGSAVGLLPGLDRAAANPWLTVALPTGLGELRNGLVVRAADAVIAVGGAYGTLSEIALALKAGRPVVGVGSWPIEGVVAAAGGEEAVTKALAALGAAPDD